MCVAGIAKPEKKIDGKEVGKKNRLSKLELFGSVDESESTSTGMSLLSFHFISPSFYSPPVPTSSSLVILSLHILAAFARFDDET